MQSLYFSVFKAISEAFSLIIPFLCLSFSAPIAAQGFTLQSEFAKQKKYYPDILPFLPDTNGITIIHNVPYASFSLDEVNTNDIATHLSHNPSPNTLQTPLQTQSLCLDIVLPNPSPQTPSTPSLRTPVIIIHGGGWSSGDKTLDLPLAIMVARAGGVAFCINYRLSNQALFPAAVQDVTQAIAYVASVADTLALNLNHLTLMGSSAGGQLAALVGAANGHVPHFLPQSTTLLTAPTPPSATPIPHIHTVIVIDGVLAFIHPDSSEGADKPGKPSSATRWLGTPMAQDTALWNYASPLSHLGLWTANRFVFINSARKRFSAGQAEFVTHLQALGKQTEQHPFPNTPHTFWLFHPWAPNVARVVQNVVYELSKE